VTIKANYQMAIDNLLDPTHASFLHKGALDDADSKDMACVKIHNHQEGRMVFQETVIPRFTPNAGIAGAFALEEAVPVIRKAKNMLHAPCFINANAVFCDSTNPDTVLSEFIASMPIVPAGPGKLHHFLATSSTFPLNDGHRGYFLNLIDQDLDAMEANQAAANPADVAWEMSVRSDETGIRARRILMKMIEDEEQASVVTA